jgi:hypothetical protein
MHRTYQSISISGLIVALGFDLGATVRGYLVLARIVDKNGLT